MSHYPVFVIGDDVEGQLARYDENLEVEPHRSPIDIDKDWVLEAIHKAGVNSNDLEAVARWMTESEWTGRPVAVDEDGLYEMTTYNPDSKWDWYEVGGRWAGHLKLKGGVNGGVNQAKAGDIDWEATRMPYAMVAEGAWKAPGRMGWWGMSSESEEELAEWNVWARGFCQGLGANVPVTVVDCHI